MAQKLLKTGKKKVATKKTIPAVRVRAVALVGTYKEKQLAWIKKHGVYNYPIKEEDALTPGSCGTVKELWLYAGPKSKRSTFSTEFIGVQTQSEFLAANPSYAKLGKPHHKKYLVFKVEFLDYGTSLEDPHVVARVSDFTGRTKKIAAAIKAFQDGGAFGSLADVLPSDLAKLPREQLRVCEAAVQLDFFASFGDQCKMDVPFPPVGDPLFTFIDLFAGIGGFRLAMQSNGGRCVFSSEWNEAAKKTYHANYGEMPYRDITKQETKDCIPKDFDILCAGFPCQPFSIAGVSNVATTKAIHSRSFAMRWMNLVIQSFTSSTSTSIRSTRNRSLEISLRSRRI